MGGKYMPNKTFDLNRIVKSPETSTKMGGDKLSILYIMSSRMLLKLRILLKLIYEQTHIYSVLEN